MRSLNLPPIPQDMPKHELKSRMKERVFLRNLETLCRVLGDDQVAKPCHCGRNPWEHMRSTGTEHLYIDDRLKLYNPKIRELVKFHEAAIELLDRACRMMFPGGEVGDPGAGAALPDPSTGSAHEQGGQAP